MEWAHFVVILFLAICVPVIQTKCRNKGETWNTPCLRLFVFVAVLLSIAAKGQSDRQHCICSFADADALEKRDSEK